MTQSVMTFSRRYSIAVHRYDAETVDKESLKTLADRVHAHDCKLIVQLFHCGRNESAKNHGDKPLLAPSVVPSPIFRAEPQEMTADDLAETKKAFASAAALCKEIGADMVEVSASAGYLLSEFFSPVTNLREDEYGYKNKIHIHDRSVSSKACCSLEDICSVGVENTDNRRAVIKRHSVNVNNFFRVTFINCTAHSCCILYKCEDKLAVYCTVSADYTLKFVGFFCAYKIGKSALCICAGGGGGTAWNCCLYNGWDCFM